MEGGRGEVGRTKLFTMTPCGRATSTGSGFAAGLDGAERASSGWSFRGSSAAMVFMIPSFPFFYPKVGNPYALIGPINDSGDWGRGGRWFFNQQFGYHGPFLAS